MSATSGSGVRPAGLAALLIMTVTLVACELPLWQAVSSPVLTVGNGATLAFRVNFAASLSDTVAGTSPDFAPASWNPVDGGIQSIQPDNTSGFTDSVVSWSVPAVDRTVSLVAVIRPREAAVDGGSVSWVIAGGEGASFRSSGIRVFIDEATVRVDGHSARAHPVRSEFVDSPTVVMISTIDAVGVSRLYLNGSLVATGPLTRSVPSTSWVAPRAELRVSDVLVTETRIYTGALRPSEIAELTRDLGGVP